MDDDGPPLVRQVGEGAGVMRVCPDRRPPARRAGGPGGTRVRGDDDALGTRDDTVDDKAGGMRGRRCLDTIKDRSSSSPCNQSDARAAPKVRKSP